MFLSSLLASLLAACTGGTRETPGDQANEKLAVLINESLDRQLRRMHPDGAAPYLPGAAARAQEWLAQLRSSTVLCRYGPRNKSRYNTFQYDLVLRDGQSIGAVESHRRCTYEGQAPLIMHVEFEQGRAVLARTDGRERKMSVEATLPEIDAFTLALLRVDQTRRPAAYRPAAPDAADLERQWRQ